MFSSAISVALNVGLGGGVMMGSGVDCGRPLDAVCGFVLA
jgi:hypothetical protein